MAEAGLIFEGKTGLSCVNYVPIVYGDAKQGIIQMGMFQSLADNYLTFSQAVNNGKLCEN